jgi:hypothetical protein
MPTFERACINAKGPTEQGLCMRRETLVHVAFRWSPAAAPDDRGALLMIESSRGRSGAGCWRSEALGGGRGALRQRLRVGREFGIPDDLALSRASGMAALVRVKWHGHTPICGP